MAVLRILPILLVCSLSQQARAQEGPAFGGSSGSAAQWLAPQPEEAKRVNERSSQPPKVRIGLRLTPFTKVSTRNQDGSVDVRYVPGQPLRHTLRARLNQTNHFFVGDWHVEMVPTTWVRKTRHYEVRLNVYRRYGAFGQLEENVGSVDLAGVLDEQQDNVHVLLGVARKRLRDKFGNPYLDVVAGFAPGNSKAEISLGERPKSGGPAEPPAGFSGELLRGRF